MLKRTAHTGRRSRLALLIILLTVSICVRLPGLFSRAIWEDESVTLLETAGHAVPTWPPEPAPARFAKSQFQGQSTLTQITRDLKFHDSHPPLYYWSVLLWQRCWGSSLNATRAFSLVCSFATILVLYAFLSVADFESPLIATGIYAFSSGSVHFGQDARCYALAILLIISAALCAYLAIGSSTPNRGRFCAYSAATGILGGAAFATHYFALFPVCVILAWFLANLPPKVRLIGVLTLASGCSVAGLGLLTLLNQLKAGSIGSGGPLTGYHGLFKELIAFGQMNVTLLWAPAVAFFREGQAHLLRGFLYAGWVFLLASSVLLLFVHLPEGRRNFWLLVLGLAVAPSAGFMLVEFIWNKHVHINRYVAFAGLAWAVIAGHGVSKLLWYRPKLGVCLAGGGLLIQFTGINWGNEIDDYMGSRMRSLAKMIQASPATSRVVVVGGSEGAWYPAAALIYELEPDVTVVTFDRERDLDHLDRMIAKYEYVWIVCAEDCSVQSPENEFLNGLLRFGFYKQLSYYPEHHAVLLRNSGIVRTT